MEAVVIQSPAADLSPINWHERAKNIPALQGAVFAPTLASPDEMIIGTNMKELHRGLREIHTPGPDARLTPLGWTVKGKAKDKRGRRMFFSRK